MFLEIHSDIFRLFLTLYMCMCLYVCVNIYVFVQMFIYRMFVNTHTHTRMCLSTKALKSSRIRFSEIYPEGTIEEGYCQGGGVQGCDVGSGSLRYC